MKKLTFGLCILFITVLTAASMARAQTIAPNPNTPPTIITFASSVPSITVEGAELGQTTATLAWHIINVGDRQKIALDTYQVSAWVSVLNTNETLPPVGTRDITIAHPLNFGPPTYRLSILDAAGKVLDERTLVIPYVSPPTSGTPTPTAPKIASFTADAQNVDANALAQRTARINLHWAVTNRLPTSNLIFEQILEDGSTVSVELPRVGQWVSSNGSGAVAPVPPNSGNRILLALLVVDVVSGQVYDQMRIALPVVGTVQPTQVPPPTPVVVNPPPSNAAAQIVRFDVSPNPADPTGLVTLTWSARGAASVGIQWNDKQQNASLHTGLPLVGTMQVSLTAVGFYGTTTRFSLLLYDAAGQYVSDQNGGIVARDFTLNLKTNMVITQFSASPNPVPRGGQVTLTWNVQGAASVGMSQTTPWGPLTLIPGLPDKLPPSGSFTVTVPEGYTTSIGYYIGGTDANGVSISANTPLTVNIICPYDTHIAPVCPLTQQVVPAAYQTFQNGTMVWRADTREIYVLYNDTTYDIYPDTWTDGEPLPVETPPNGLIQPQRGFGKVWETRSGVKDRLGWATSIESSYSTTIETTNESNGRFPASGIYFRFPNGQVVHLSALPKQWELKS